MNRDISQVHVNRIALNGFIAITKEKLKTLKFLTPSLALVLILSACSLITPAQIPALQPTDSLAAPTAQVRATPTLIFPPTLPVLTMTVLPNPTPFPPNTPVWVIYTFTCKTTAGGSTMTMDLTWSDRSDNEEGYTVYRDKQVIAILAPNSTNYMDVAFVATGKTLSYSVEAFNTNWRANSSTITYGCQ